MSAPWCRRSQLPDHDYAVEEVDPEGGERDRAARHGRGGEDHAADDVPAEHGELEPQSSAWQAPHLHRPVASQASGRLFRCRPHRWRRCGRQRPGGRRRTLSWLEARLVIVCLGDLGRLAAELDTADDMVAAAKGGAIVKMGYLF